MAKSQKLICVSQADEMFYNLELNFEMYFKTEQAMWFFFFHMPFI